MLGCCSKTLDELKEKLISIEFQCPTTTDLTNKSIKLARGAVDTFVLPQVFLTLFEYLGQAIICTPENPNCNINPAVYLGAVTFVIYELSQFIATVIYANKDDGSAVKDFIKRIMIGAHDYGKEILSNFLFIFLVLMRIAGEFSKKRNKDDPAKQGEISYFDFAMIILLSLALAVFSAEKIKTCIKKCLQERGDIEASLREAFSGIFSSAFSGKIAVALKSLVVALIDSLLLAPIPEVSKARFGLLAYTILGAYISNKPIVNELPWEIARWILMGVVYFGSAEYHLLENIVGADNAAIKTTAKTANVLSDLCLIIPLLMSVYSEFSYNPYITCTLVMISLFMRILEHTRFSPMAGRDKKNEENIPLYNSVNAGHGDIQADPDVEAQASQASSGCCFSCGK